MSLSHLYPFLLHFPSTLPPSPSLSEACLCSPGRPVHTLLHCGPQTPHGATWKRFCGVPSALVCGPVLFRVHAFPSVSPFGVFTLVSSGRMSLPQDPKRDRSPGINPRVDPHVTVPAHWPRETTAHARFGNPPGGLFRGSYLPCPPHCRAQHRATFGRTRVVMRGSAGPERPGATAHTPALRLVQEA